MPCIAVTTTVLRATYKLGTKVASLVSSAGVSRQAAVTVASAAGNSSEPELTMQMATARQQLAPPPVVPASTRQQQTPVQAVTVDPFQEVLKLLLGTQGEELT